MNNEFAEGGKSRETTHPDKTAAGVAAPGAVDDATKAELLLNHYNDTMQLTLRQWRARNRLFLFLLLLLAAMAIDLCTDASIGDAINAYLDNLLGRNGNDNPPLLATHVAHSAC